MASVAGRMIGGGYVGSSSSWLQMGNRQENATMKNVAGTRKSSRMFCVSSSLVKDPYTTLRIQPDASESEVKKAFRKLALEYHPDVCKGSNCGVKFSMINEAYNIVMTKLREKKSSDEEGMMRRREEPEYEVWEEWMGWEGGGIRDYSSHINPYI
ncbi:Chaperone protein dnaJ 8, chloroplastic [Linum perenne]